MSHVVRVELGAVVGRAKALKAEAQHAGSLLQRLFEAAADGHYLADAFHRASQRLIDLAELIEIPTRELDDHVVQRGLEAGAGRLRDVIGQVRQGVTERQLGGDPGKRIARRLAGQGRAAREAGIYLDHAVVDARLTGLVAHGRLRVQRKLDVALADHPQMANGSDSHAAQNVVFLVRQRLRWSNHDALARVNAHGIDVLHVAHDDTVVRAVAYHLVLELFPAGQVLLDEHLTPDHAAGASASTLRADGAL